MLACDQTTGQTLAGSGAPASSSPPASASAASATRCGHGPNDTRATPTDANCAGVAPPGIASTLTLRTPIRSTRRVAGPYHRLDRRERLVERPHTVLEVAADGTGPDRAAHGRCRWPRPRR